MGVRKREEENPNPNPNLNQDPNQDLNPRRERQVKNHVERRDNVNLWINSYV